MPQRRPSVALCAAMALRDEWLGASREEEWIVGRAQERLRETRLRRAQSQSFIRPSPHIWPSPHMAASHRDHVFVFPFDPFTQWAAEGETFGEESENLNKVLDMLGVKEAFPLRVASRRFSRFIGGTGRWDVNTTLRVLTHALRAGRFGEESGRHSTANELAVLRTIIAYKRQSTCSAAPWTSGSGFLSAVAYPEERLAFRPPWRMSAASADETD